MARSLLDYVQIIMDDMGSDSVNDFGDSLEAQRVASILRRTFFDLMAEQDLPTADELFALTALSDPTRPTHMQVDTSVRNINWIQYDNRADATDDQIRYIDIDYMDPQVFFRHVWGKNSTDAEILVVDATPNVKLAIQTNANPRFWTSFDGETIIFDAIDQTISTTLEASKVVAHGTVTKGWVHENNAIPDIPEHMTSTFLAMAEERAFIWVKQQDNRVVLDNARRYRISGRADKARLTDGFVRYPNFGRSSPKLSRRSRLGDNVFNRGGRKS